MSLEVGPYGQTKKYVVDPVVMPKSLGPSLQWNVLEALLPLSSHYIVTLSVRQYATIPVLAADLQTVMCLYQFKLENLDGSLHTVVYFNGMLFVK